MHVPQPAAFMWAQLPEAHHAFESHAVPDGPTHRPFMQVMQVLLTPAVPPAQLGWQSASVLQVFPRSAQQ